MRGLRKYWSLMGVILFITPVHAAPTKWQTLAPGLEYTRINSLPGLPNGNLHAFRIDLQHYRLALAFSQDYGNNTNTVAGLVRAHHAIAGVNGGFFSTELKPIGLRISEGKQRTPLKNTSWWGVFFIKNKQAYIVAQNVYKSDDNIKFAVQSGPRLLINGIIPNLKPGTADRTALGITKNGRVILLASENLPITTLQLAQIMQSSTAEGGLDCVNAINLDGGSSTQLYAKINQFILDVPGYSSITDAVLIKSY